jgi:hypothetical protein
LSRECGGRVASSVFVVWEVSGVLKVQLGPVAFVLP